MHPEPAAAHCIDMHTHAFPDRVAAHAIPKLEHEGNIKAFLDGTVAALQASMDQNGIDQSVICSIATRPEQFGFILNWSVAIRSERLLPFPSVHPQDPDALAQLQRIAELGFKGVKMHPYYQDYMLDDPALNRLYAKMSDLGLILVIHAGYDIAFPRIRRADPERIRAVCRAFPGLRFVATHFGGWEEWDEVRRLLLGQPIYMELSFAAEGLGPERFKEMLLAHDPDYLLFGSDSPWTDQGECLGRLRDLALPGNLFTRITSTNAHRLLQC